MNKKNIIIIIVLIGFIFIGMKILGGSADTSSTGLTVDGSTSNSADAKYVYALLQEMNQVKKLDDTLFSDPIFQSLKDNTVVFAAQEAGRNNPFSPVGSDLLGNQTHTVATTTTKK